MTIQFFPPHTGRKEGMPSSPHARNKYEHHNANGNRDPSAGIGDHDLKLQTLYNDCYECEICLKWRHCPGEGFGEQDRFTCEMAPSPGLVPGDSGGCAREEDLEWLYEPGIIPRGHIFICKCSLHLWSTCGPLVYFREPVAVSFAVAFAIAVIVIVTVWVSVCLCHFIQC